MAAANFIRPFQPVNAIHTPGSARPMNPASKISFPSHNSSTSIGTSGRTHNFRTLVWLDGLEGAMAALLLMSHLAFADAPRPEIQLDPLPDGRGAQLSVAGTAGLLNRLEVSTNLTEWRALTTQFNSTGSTAYIDSDSIHDTARFYRAIQFEAPAELQSSQASGDIGARLELFGTSFAPLRGDNIVRFGMVAAPVLEASPNRLLVEIPPGAASGAISVITPEGAQRSGQPFTVTAETSVEFDLPIGVDSDQFDVVSTYGAAARVGGTASVRVRADQSLLVFALPKNANRSAFFCAVSVSAGSSVRFSAASTAEALVFMHPLFMAREPDAAARILEIIRATPEVQELAAVIADLSSKPGNPFANDTFITAFREATFAVGNRPEVLVLALNRRDIRDREPAELPRAASNSDLDLNFVEVTTSEKVPERGLAPRQLLIEERRLNPVDWFVSVRRVDTKAAFPNGLNDLGLASREKRTLGLDPKNPVGYPVLEDFEETKLVEAELGFGKFDLLGVATDKIGELLKPEEKLILPDQSGVYLVRAVGPAFSLFGFDKETIAEAAFLDQDREGLRIQRARALALNIISLVTDLAGAIVDLRELGENDKGEDAAEILSGVFVDLVAQAPNIEGMDDVLEILFDTQVELFAKLATLTADGKLKQLLTGAARETAKTVAETATGVLELLNVIGAFGQVGERLSGFLRTTPMESAFVVVGDPFGLDILSAEPKEGGPGDIISVVISGGSFSTANRHDHVYFVPPNAPGVDSQVTAADALPGGKQKLTVIVPEDLQQAPEGPLTLLVTANGRRGENGSVFTLKRHPRVTRMIESSGFAAADDFLGAPFPGGSVTLLGLDFGPANSFFFGGAKATNVVADARGGVTINVPKGASSGPIRIENHVSDTDVRIGTSPPFTVLGPPVIDSAEPKMGPVGTVIAFKLRNAGGESVNVFLAGGLRAAASGFREDFEMIVPPGAANGEVTVVTPAGAAVTGFVVTEGLAKGAELTVGNVNGCQGPIDSPISLPVALRIAAGDEPLSKDFDDEDIRRDRVNGILVPVEVDLNCEWEQGDFVSPDLGAYVAPDADILRDPSLRWPVGAVKADTIIVTEGTGTLDGDFVVAGGYDTLIAGSLSGSMTITGSNNVVNVDHFEGSRLLIEGDYNTVRGDFSLTAGIMISGNQNTFSGSVSNSAGDGLILSGNANDVTVVAANNTGDGVLINGGSHNKVTVDAGLNGGNGLQITGGANGNFISPATGQPLGPEFVNGNGQHGVVLTGAARGNRILPHAPIGANGRDGLHLEGAGVQDTLVVIFDSAGNRGDGIFVGGGAKGTTLRSVVARSNRGTGLVMEGCMETQVGNARSGFNDGDGIRISGISDGNTFIDSFELRDNKETGLRVADSSRLRLTGVSQGGKSGLEVSGGSSKENTLDVRVLLTSGPGAILREATQNKITLDARNGDDVGVLVSGATQNELTVTAVANAQDGLLLNEGAEANTIFATVMRNRCGVTLNGAKRNALFDLRANANQEHGLRMTGPQTQLNRIVRARVGLKIEDEPEGNQGDGILIEAGASQNDLGSDAGGGPDIRNNKGAGVRVTGNATIDNIILGAKITRGDSGQDQEAGVIVEDGAQHTIIGGSQAAGRNEISGNKIGVALRSGATGAIVQNNLLEGNTDKAVTIDNASLNFIGGTLPNTGNEISESLIGAEISGAQSHSNRIAGNHIFHNNDGVSLSNNTSQNTIGGNNVIEKNNVVGLRFVDTARNVISGNNIRNQFGDGILFTGASDENEVRGNTILGNAVGVHVVGANAVANLIQGNVIASNDITGIDLSAGGNHSQPSPVITGVTSQSVLGTVEAPDNSTIEVFRDLGFQGEKFLGQAIVSHGRFAARLSEEIETNKAGQLFNITATVTTTPQKDTSEFGSVIDATAGVPSQIVFTSTRDGNEELYLTDGFEFSAARLTDHPAADRSPALSPDGKTVAFVSGREGNPEIYLLELSNTTNITRLTTEPAPDYDPAWSPSGANIVFVSERDGNAEIYLMNSDGSDAKRLMNDPGVDLHPSFSPDGTRIVFSSNRLGNFEIFGMNADGSNVHPLTSASAADIRPEFSPDGELIAFVSERDGNAEVYTMKTDGSQLTQLTENPADDLAPSWLPNGSALVFSSNRDEGFELYLVPRLGGAPERITISHGDNTEPAAR